MHVYASIVKIQQHQFSVNFIASQYMCDHVLVSKTFITIFHCFGNHCFQLVSLSVAYPFFFEVLSNIHSMLKENYLDSNEYMWKVWKVINLVSACMHYFVSYDTYYFCSLCYTCYWHCSFKWYVACNGLNFTWSPPPPPCKYSSMYFSRGSDEYFEMFHSCSYLRNL